MLKIMGKKIFTVFRRYVCLSKPMVIYPLVKISKTFERKIMIIFLSIFLNMCFRCSKELSHRDCSFEYPQHYVLVDI